MTNNRFQKNNELEVVISLTLEKTRKRQIFQPNYAFFILMLLIFK